MTTTVYVTVCPYGDKLAYVAPDWLRRKAAEQERVNAHLAQKHGWSPDRIGDWHDAPEMQGMA